MSGLDRRTARDRDATLQAQIERDGGISVTVLCSNRDHAASIHRLIASGRLRFSAQWIALERPTLRERLREWARRMRVWMCGWNTDEGV
jgi:hypothetical protein